eukprot:scaffold7682_cov82-Phaeocystis_antarctica.AAC.3
MLGAKTCDRSRPTYALDCNKHPLRPPCPTCAKATSQRPPHVPVTGRNARPETVRHHHTSHAQVPRIGVEGGGVALCPVGCDALVVSCSRRVGSWSDLILPAGAWFNSEVRSHQDQRQKAKGEKSEGKRSSSSAGPGGRQQKKRNTTEQRLSPYSK